MEYVWLYHSSVLYRGGLGSPSRDWVACSKSTLKMCGKGGANMTVSNTEAQREGLERAYEGDVEAGSNPNAFKH